MLLKGLSRPSRKKHLQNSFQYGMLNDSIKVEVGSMHMHLGFQLCHSHAWDSRISISFIKYRLLFSF